MKGRRVLVADDDPTARLLFGAALEPAGFSVTLVADGQAAVAAFERDEFDLAVLDVEMPMRDGLSVAERIRALRGAAFPIVLASGRDDAGFLDAAAALGAVRLGKPVDWRALPDFLAARLAV